MRILGLDLGDKTIGVSICDPLGITAQGLETIQRLNENEYKKSLRRISEIIEEYGVETIVLGYPKNMDNSEGERCEKTLAFKERLEKRFPKIPVVLWDERLSTASARNSLRSAGTFGRLNQKKVIDKIAAVFILQGYLDSRS